MKRINKKAQEEIIGLVLIMVLVAVAVLVFLSISIRKNVGASTESREVYQFLESSMELTTDCEIKFRSDYASLGELFEVCYDKNKCLDGDSACNVLREELQAVLDSSWIVSDESRIRGYNFSSAYKTELSLPGKEVISLSRGICEGNKAGATYIVPAFPGKIDNSFEICY